MDFSEYCVGEDGRFPDDTAYIDESEYMSYSLNLGAETGSTCLTPALSRKSSQLRLRIDPVKRVSIQGRREEGDCGICFEHVVTPIRTRCCGAVFCAEHINSWLHGPAADGHCPACRFDSLSSSTSSSLSSYASSSADASSWSASASPLSKEADHAFPAAALQSLRSVLDLHSLNPEAALQSRWQDIDLDTHTKIKEPLSSFLGTRSVLLAIARVVGCVLVIGVLAGRGRWGGGSWVP